MAGAEESPADSLKLRFFMPLRSRFRDNARQRPGLTPVAVQSAEVRKWCLLQGRARTRMLSESRAQMAERISVLKTDITTLAVDAIVNAANTTLLGGGGVDGAIHRAAGPELYDECALLGGCSTGQAKLTKGYRLPAKYVIHAVGPVWTGGDRGEPELLASCYRSVFRIAREQELKSLAFPAISCGVYRFPVDRAVEIAVRETRAELERNPALEQVIFACFGDDVYSSYVKALKMPG
jgi:O-acetyl-ADP-ribose deacetylase